MPITYINPAPKARKARRKLFGAALMARKKRLAKGKKKGGGRVQWPLHGAALIAHRKALKKRTLDRKRRSAAHRAKRWGRFGKTATNPSRKKKVSRAAKRRAPKRTHTTRKAMAKRKKLYGAAAKAHAKKMGRKSKRRKSRKGGRKGGRKSSWRVRAAKKAARTRAAKKAARSAAAKKAYRSRKRRGGGKRRHKRSHGRRTKRSHKRRSHKRLRVRARKIRLTLTANPRRRRRRRNPRPTTAKSLLRARRAIRNRYKTSLARATKRRYRMRSNPSIGGAVGGVMSLIKQAAPVALALYGSRAASYKLAGKIPGFNKIPATYQGSAMALLLIGVTHFATKKVAFLRPYRAGALVGTTINLFDNVLSAFAPASVKGMFGLSDIYDSGMGDYMQVGDYVSMGATPIDDDITLNDYVTMGGLEQELGVEEDLGLDQELGASTGLSRAYLGGVSQSSMLAPVPQQQLLAPVPQRSFTKEIRSAGDGYDRSDALYTGVFGGGF